MIIRTIENAKKLVGRYFLDPITKDIYTLLKSEYNDNEFLYKIIYSQRKEYIGIQAKLYIYLQWYVELIEDIDINKILRSLANEKKSQFDLEPNKIFL